MADDHHAGTAIAAIVLKGAAAAASGTVRRGRLTMNVRRRHISTHGAVTEYARTAAAAGRGHGTTVTTTDVKTTRIGSTCREPHLTARGVRGIEAVATCSSESTSGTARRAA